MTNLDPVLDQRTRYDHRVEDLDPATFLDRDAPLLLERYGELAGRAARVWELPPLAVDVDGDTFTFVPQDRGLRIENGISHGAVVAVMSRENFSDWIQDQCSSMGMILGSLVEMRSGEIDDLIEWDPALRALLDGRPGFEPGCIQFKDRRGDPLDLSQSFRLGDDPDEVAQFLAEAGFLHIRGVFDSDLMNEISRDIDAAIPNYAPDDENSWWARTSAGEHRPVRLERFHEHSPATLSLLHSERFLSIGKYGRAGFEPRDSAPGSNAIEALVKPLGVVEGISDLPWHKDCALGRHSYECCGMTVGISVTGADERSGELGVLAGSHRTSIPASGVHPRVDLPKVPLPTEIGDVTVHLSCTAHMSRPPVDRERRVMYTGFGLPRRANDIAAPPDKLSRIREGAPQAMGAESRDRLGRAGSFEL
jgi:hypothetical protein